MPDIAVVDYGMGNLRSVAKALAHVAPDRSIVVTADPGVIRTASRVVVDLSGRPGLEFHVPFTRAMIGAFDVDLAHEFFQGFVNHALVTVHVDNLRGRNAHHQAETVFKAFARALRMAATPDARAGAAIPSTKGAL